MTLNDWRDHGYDSPDAVLKAFSRQSLEVDEEEFRTAIAWMPEMVLRSGPEMHSAMRGWS